MNIVVLIGGGRTGIDFLQSLFDQHSQVSQFPGVFFFDEFWKSIENENDPKKILNHFYKRYEKFFDSRLNLMERHYMLGVNKKSFYLVNKKIFEKEFLKLFSNKELTKVNLIKALHLAYSIASGEDASQKKTIILHLHHVFRLKVLDGIKYECIYTIRDPLASYTSLMKNWHNIKKNKQQTPSIYFFHIDRMFNGVKDTTNLNKKTHVIRLEDLHRKNEKVMRSLCKKINISYEEKMKNSTYHGLVWWGDKVSGRDINGVNSNFSNKIDEKLFYKKDIKCIEYFMDPFLRKYEYPIREKKENCSLIKYLPLKLEIAIWLKTIFSFNLKETLLILYLWYKRVNLMNEKNYKNVIFPDQIGK